MSIALVGPWRIWRTGPRGMLGQKGRGFAKMTRDSKIKGLHGGLNATSVSEKDHAQTNVVEARFRKGSRAGAIFEAPRPICSRGVERKE